MHEALQPRKHRNIGAMERGGRILQQKIIMITSAKSEAAP